MSGEEERQSPVQSEGAVEESAANTLVLGLDSPSDEKHPDFPIGDIFPTDLRSMVYFQELLEKYNDTLRKLLETQKDSVKKYAENKGIPWDTYVQLRKEEVLANTNMNDPGMTFMENWKDESFLPQCHRTVMHIQLVHLCRWTLYKKVQSCYKENKDAPRLSAHLKDQTSEDLDAFDGDSISHKEYVRNKREEEELMEKTAVLIFNRLGTPHMTDIQIRCMEKVMEKLLKEREYRFVRYWADEAVKVTQEINNQSLADLPSISLDDPSIGANSEDPTIPPTPNPSFASDAGPSSEVEGDLKDVHLSEGGTL